MKKRSCPKFEEYLKFLSQILFTLEHKWISENRSNVIQCSIYVDLKLIVYQTEDSDAEKFWQIVSFCFIFILSVVIIFQTADCVPSL